MSRLISCASYFGSGSSAVTDLLGEYKGIKSLTDYEFRFIQDIDGLMDLEYHIVECPNRHNSGHAIKRFLRLCKFYAGSKLVPRYEPFFNNHFWEYTLRFIDSITSVKYHGYWFADLYDRGRFSYVLRSIWGKIQRRMMKGDSDLLPNEITYCPLLSEELFFKSAREYISCLLQAANPDNLPIIMVDQLIPSSNLDKSLRFFSDDTKVVIVDRDPRDVYLMHKYVWHDHIIPDNVLDFCKWFDFTHKCNQNQSIDSRKVLVIKFEDLVYNYHSTVEVLDTFLGFTQGDHISPFSKFNPRRSVNNTKLWNRYSDENSIGIIKDNLRQYLYDFESVVDMAICGKPEDDMSLF